MAKVLFRQADRDEASLVVYEDDGKVLHRISLDRLDVKLLAYQLARAVYEWPADEAKTARATDRHSASALTFE